MRIYAIRAVLQVLQFYESMNMRVPNKPPLLLVESSALESAEAREGRSNAGHRHGPAPVRSTACAEDCFKHLP